MLVCLGMNWNIGCGGLNIGGGAPEIVTGSRDGNSILKQLLFPSPAVAYTVLRYLSV